MNLKKFILKFDYFKNRLSYEVKKHSYNTYNSDI